MTSERGPGRLVRGGRSLARVTLVWLTATVTLWVLDDALDGFDLEHWWLAPVCALLLRLLAAVVWPLVMRVALPFAVYTLGLGGLVLLAVAVVGLFALVPGVALTGPLAALAVVLGTAVATVLVSGLLAIDPDEIFFRRAGRRARHRDAGDGSPSPGVLFLQVDGLSLPILRRAARDGTMPTLARWLTEGSHDLAGWHTDWSAQTGASQCGILHGYNDDVVGFRWYEKDRRRVMTCSSPGDVAEIERRHSDGHGLLSQDGAGRGNLFTGDAAHISLTLSAVPLLTRRRGGRARSDRSGAGYYPRAGADPGGAAATTARSAPTSGGRWPRRYRGRSSPPSTATSISRGAATPQPCSARCSCSPAVGPALDLAALSDRERDVLRLSPGVSPTARSPVGSASARTPSTATWPTSAPNSGCRREPPQPHTPAEPG